MNQELRFVSVPVLEQEVEEHISPDENFDQAVSAVLFFKKFQRIFRRSIQQRDQVLLEKVFTASIATKQRFEEVQVQGFEKKINLMNTISGSITFASQVNLGIFATHVHGLCACLFQAPATSLGSFSLPSGGHYHIGSDGRKIYHDEEHKLTSRPSVLNKPSQLFVPSTQKKVSTSKASSSSAVKTFSLVPKDQSAKLSELFAIGPKNCISPKELLPMLRLSA